jgi:hypothetical protein
MIDRCGGRWGERLRVHAGRSNDEWRVKVVRRRWGGTERVVGSRKSIEIEIEHEC